MESFVRCDGIQLKSTSFPERIHRQRHWYLLNTHPLNTALHVQIHNSCLFFHESVLTYCCGWESHVAEAQRHQSEYNVYMSRPINPNLEGIAPDHSPLPFSQFEQVHCLPWIAGRQTKRNRPPVAAFLPRPLARSLSRGSRRLPDGSRCVPRGDVPSAGRPSKPRPRPVSRIPRGAPRD